MGGVGGWIFLIFFRFFIGTAQINCLNALLPFGINFLGKLRILFDACGAWDFHFVEVELDTSVEILDRHHVA